MTSANEIWIITDETSELITTETNASAKGGFARGHDNQPETETINGGLVPVETLQENLSQLLNNIDESLAKINNQETRSGFKI